MAGCPACGADNPAGARFCNACGEPMPVVTLGGEFRKTVTVIFCDVIGSTALGERLDPEALRRMMGRYFASMTEAIERHGGTVEKFIGDAVMAVFGIPTTHEDDALRAVRAAADMQDGLRSLNKEFERDQGTTLTCRIGVNTGEVVAGDASARQALVTGDAVNVAARLEQGAPPGEVLLSESTLRLVRDAVVAEPVDPLTVKGKSEPVPAHRLVAVHAGAAGVTRRPDSPLVGRERQLEQLQRAFDETVADRACHLFTVLGSAGVGKSRLVQEALARIHDATVVRGRCLSYGEGITYWPLVEVVRDALGPARASETDMAGAIASLLPSDPSAAQVAARVAQLVGGSSDMSVPGEEVGWAIRRFFEGLAKERPLVVVLDDIQWAEPGLLDLLDQVTDMSRDAPILLVCMARTELLEERPDWGGGKLRATTAALEPLSVEESETLVANLLGTEALDAQTRDRILAAAEGNPLFVEETIGMLLDDGVLRRAGGRWSAAGDLREVTVPPTIQALLEARLDRLDGVDRAVLGRAAVVGQVFYLGAVRALSPEAERELVSRRAQQLVRRDLIRPDASDLAGEDAFRFRHGLFRDAAYQMLPKETRADLHERLAAWLEERATLLDLDEFVGYHLERAHAYRTELGPEDDRSRALADRAAERLSAAATRARDRADLRAAENLFARAAALWVPEDARRAWDLIGVGWARFDQDRFRDSVEPFEQAFDIAAAGGDGRAEGHAALGRANARLFTDPEGGATDAIASLVDRLIPRFESWGDERGLALAYLSRAQGHWNACRYEAVRLDMGRCLPHARAAGDRSLESQALGSRLFAGVAGSASVDVIFADSERLERESASFPTLRPLALAGRGVALAMIGRFDEARGLCRDSHELHLELQGFGEAEEDLWRVEMLAGELGAAEAHAQQNRGLSADFGDLGHGSTAAVQWALTCYGLGKYEDARRLARECRDTGASDDVVNQHQWRAVEAGVLAHEDRLEEADRLIDEAVVWVERTDALLDQVTVYGFRADISARLGRRDDARAALAKARDAAVRKGATVVVEQVDRQAAELGLA